MKQKRRVNEIIGIVFFLTAIFLQAVSVFLCFSSDIWYDELFTMGLADQPLGKLISITARDVHPPLYYMIVKLFVDITGAFSGSIQPVAAAKLVSVLPFLLCDLYGMTLVRKRFGMLTAGLFCFLLSAMPGLPGYMVEVRMYGFAMFFVTALMLHGYELILEYSGQEQPKKRNWILLTLYAVAACYTHYFACVAAAAVYLYLLTALFKKKAWKKILLSGMICAASFAPWLFLAVTGQIKAVSANYWIEPVSFRTLLGCVKFLFMPQLGGEKENLATALFLILMYGGLLLAQIFSYLKQEKGERNREEMGFLFGALGCLASTIVFGFLASVLIRPIFVYRYMLPAAGAFWLVFAVCAGKQLKGDRALLVLSLLVFSLGVRNYRAFYGDEMWKRTQMEKASAVLEEIGTEDILIFNFGQLQAVISYYLGNDSYLWYESTEKLITEMYPQDHSLVEEEFSDEEGIRRLQKLLETGKTVWFLGSGNARDEIIEKWEQEQITAQQISEAMVERYWFNLYQLKSVASDID